MLRLAWVLLMAPLFTQPIARDGLDGTDTDEIDGRALDGDDIPTLAGVGNYLRDPTSNPYNSLGIRSNVGVAIAGSGTSRPDAKLARYTITDIPALPSALRTEMVPTYPDRTGGSGPCGDVTIDELICEDDCTGSDTEDVEGRSVTTGSGTWASRLIDGVKPADTIQLHGNRFTTWAELFYVVLGTGVVGRDYAVRVTGHFDTWLTNNGSEPNIFGPTARMRHDWFINPPTWPGQGTPGMGALLQQDIFNENQYFLGALSVGELSLGVDYTVEVIVTGRFTMCINLYGPDGFIAGYQDNNAWDRAVFPGEEYPGIYLRTQSLNNPDAVPSDRTEPHGCYVTKWQLYSITPSVPTSVSNPDGRAEVSLCATEDGLNRYSWRQEFDIFGSPEVFYTLEALIDGELTGLRYPDGISPVSLDTPLPFSLAKDAAGVLHGYHGDTEIVTFDPATELAEDTEETITPLADGLPGVGGYDGGGIGWSMDLTQVTVYKEGCIPSTGGGGGGPGGGGSTGAQQVWANGMFHNVTDAWQWENGIFRKTLGPEIMDPQKVWSRGKMRDVLLASINGDPGTPDGPPLPSCDDPTPWIPVDPAPLTDRLFFVWEMAVNLINATPFTAVVTSLGSWTPGNIATAVGLGGQIISSQGNYPKFFTGGAYDPAKMDAWIASQIPIESGLNVAGYYGCSVIDDFNWPPAWPPSGVSLSEIARFCAVWKAQFPWQRLTIRGRPRELLGQNFSGLLDSCIAQWHTRFGDPTAFRTAELAAAASIGVPAILWSMNFTNGGDGSSGIPGTLPGMWEMSAAEVLAVGAVFTDPATEATGIANHGVGGWKCNRPGQPPILSRSGMVAALTTVRNQLAAL